MSTEVQIAMISTIGLVLVALIGVLVEMVRVRKRHEIVVNEVTPNGGGSMRDIASRIETQVDKIRETQVAHGERLAKVEAKMENWQMPNRRASDGK